MRITDLPPYTTPSYLEPTETHSDGCWMAETGHLGPCRQTTTTSTKSGILVETVATFSNGRKVVDVRTYPHKSA